jgi:hypothetical protein
MSKTGKEIMEANLISRKEYGRRCPGLVGFEIACPVYAPDYCTDETICKCWDVVEQTRYRKE